MNAPSSTPLSFSGPGGACRLDDRSVVRASGADAVDFLHGQFSNDVKKLDAQHARLAAYCDAKGRMLASFVYAKTTEGDVLMVCAADVMAAAVKRLSMFVMRAKAKLAVADDLCCVGVAGAAGAAALPPGAAELSVWDKLDHEGALVVRLPEGAGTARWLWIGPNDKVDALLAVAGSGLDATTWQWLDVASGVASVVAATSGAFVPQMLNYELVGGVDFKKGCYPGQEVVARSQYLGKLKRRGILLQGAADATPGQPVFWSADPAQPAGMVAQAARQVDGSSLILAELKIGTLESGSLHLGAADGAVLSITPLPYTLPHEAPAS